MANFHHTALGHVSRSGQAEDQQDGARAAGDLRAGDAAAPEHVGGDQQQDAANRDAERAFLEVRMGLAFGH
jgi:hypothetical protein